MRKIFEYLGNTLGVLGMVLVAGSIAAAVIGRETLSAFYDKNKPLVYCGLAGVGLVTIGILFSVLGGNRDPLSPGPQADAAAGAVPNPSTRCVKCEAINAAHAKFCDQCGRDLTSG